MSQVAEIIAKMQLSFAPRTLVPLIVTERVDAPAGWDIGIDEAVSQRLALGVWTLDAKLTLLGGDVQVLNSVGVTVTQPASTQ